MIVQSLAIPLKSMINGGPKPFSSVNVVDSHDIAVKAAGADPSL